MENVINPRDPKYQELKKAIEEGKPVQFNFSAPNREPPTIIDRIGNYVGITSGIANTISTGAVYGGITLGCIINPLSCPFLLGTVTVGTAVGAIVVGYDKYQNSRLMEIQKIKDPELKKASLVALNNETNNIKNVVLKLEEKGESATLTPQELAQTRQQLVQIDSVSNILSKITRKKKKIVLKKPKTKKKSIVTKKKKTVR
jgi:hypothetical protein